MSDETFRSFQETNRRRCEEGFGHAVAFDEPSWPLQNWALAIAGEAGELCNLVKKCLRGDFTVANKRDDIKPGPSSTTRSCTSSRTASPTRRWCGRPWPRRTWRSRCGWRGARGGSTAMPERIQRSRAKGWRMPPNTVYVGRPSKWGNPFVVGKPALLSPMHFAQPIVAGDRHQAVRLFKAWFSSSRVRNAGLIPELRGKDLACWCPLDQPCHADVLLEWANGEETR